MSFMHLVVTFGIIKPMETIVLLMTIEESIVSYSEFHLNMKLCKAQVVMKFSGIRPNLPMLVKYDTAGLLVQG